MAEKKHPFISYLESLSDNRGALAALRRGLGQPPGTVPAMYPYVVPWLPKEPSHQYEFTLYLVASLFAYHADAGGYGNMGDHFARARVGQADNTAIERRFSHLLEAHPEDLPFYLRQAVSFLKSNNIPINWEQLFLDLQWLNHSAHNVQKQWARAYWGHRQPEDDQSINQNNEEV